MEAARLGGISLLPSNLAWKLNRHGLLLILGALLLAALAPIAALSDLRVQTSALLVLWLGAHVAYLIAAWVVTRGAAHAPSPGPLKPGPSRRVMPLVIVFGVALAARLVLIPTPPLLSEDLYRYLWDGRLVSHGVNPFSRPPADPSLARFQDDLLLRLNHADVPTIYPPAAQLFFGAVARIELSPRAFKSALLPVEIALWIALASLLRRRGLRVERILLLAWNPLVIIESYGSGHIDLLAAAFLTIALALFEAKRMASAGAIFAIAALTKYTPLLIAPYFLRRRAAILLGVAAAAAILLFLPFWSAGASLWSGLTTYLARWEFNGSLYPLLRVGIRSEEWTRIILAAALAAGSLWISVRARTATGAAMALFAGYLLTSPTVYPWYLVPLVALLPLHADAGILVFSGLVALSYAPLPTYLATGAWTLPAWVPCVEYGGTIVAVVAGAVLARRSSRTQARRAACATESTPT